jgi:hypothetical protein
MILPQIVKREKPLDVKVSLFGIYRISNSHVNFISEIQEPKLSAKEYIEFLDLRRENQLLKAKLATAEKKLDDMIVIGAEKARAWSDQIISTANTITREEYKVKLFVI